jgi:hypothetical protein
MARTEHEAGARFITEILLYDMLIAHRHLRILLKMSRKDTLTSRTQIITAVAFATILVFAGIYASIQMRAFTPPVIPPDGNNSTIPPNNLPVIPPVTPSGNLSYPSDGQISIGNAGANYLPWTLKEEVIPLFISLADNYSGTYESIGKSSSPYNWDIILFKFGNPTKPAVMIDSYLHGNEYYGEEVLYSLMKWLLTSQDPNATQILKNNYILVVPVVDYRWGRTNYDSPSWMTKMDPSADGAKCGVNLNRNFGSRWPYSLGHSDTDAYSGTAPNSEKETQALIYAWNKYHPRIYWDLHSGEATETWAAAADSSLAQVDINKVQNILPAIQTSLRITNRWTLQANNISGWGDSYGGASDTGVAGFQSEIMSGWDNAAWKKASLDSGNTFAQIEAIFITMCKAIEQPRS